jgi:energy-coupling factor transport system substrate-specific component
MGIFSLWGNVRMVVLVAVTAALYAAILIPFKAFTIIPGFTEMRPANAIPVVCSLLFGPAAAWGSAIGNLVGDIFGGTFTAGSAFGFLGNFCYGWLPFLLWRKLTRKAPTLQSGGQIGVFIVACLGSSVVCAAIIAFGLHLIGVPIALALFKIIFANNAVMSLVLGAVLLVTLYPAVRSLGLLYDQLAAPRDTTERDLDEDPTQPQDVR